MRYIVYKPDGQIVKTGEATREEDAMIQAGAGESVRLVDEALSDDGVIRDQDLRVDVATQSLVARPGYTGSVPTIKLLGII